MATEVTYREVRRKYRWPEVQLNLWIFIILAGAATTLGIFAWFIAVQNQLEVGVPWYENEHMLCHGTQANDLQALPFRNRHRLVDFALSRAHTCFGSATAAYPRNHPSWVLHSLRPVAYDPDRNSHSAVWSSWQRQLELQRLCYRARISWHIC
jgi:hypothetical protein